jgi:ubiquinone/menaquinone biosynthesis C-methylase UbiE
MNIFEKYYKKYDSWYDKNKFTYFSELKLLSAIIPKNKKGLEIGVGTGRFAEPLGIKYGIDPSENMLKFAKDRGIIVKKASGENIPFDDNIFDYTAIIITLAFVKDPKKVIKEAARVTKEDGLLIAAIVESDSFLADFYRKKKGPFYKNAHFIKIDELNKWLENEGFANIKHYQTVFDTPENIKGVQDYKKAWGQGGFVVTIAEKI